MSWKVPFILVIVAVLFVSGCVQQIPDDEPDWVKEHIQKELEAPVANPPTSLSKCTYKGQVVYYMPPRCCDMYGLLYDNDGNVICAPDGGITGDGDGRCNDFFIDGNACVKIWQDPRSYP